MITDLLRSLRHMPYTDMILVATELQKILPHPHQRIDARTLADALATLATASLPDRSDSSRVDQEMLRKVFTRNQTIKVRRLVGAQSKHGWQVETAGASVLNTDLKTAIDQLLDTVAAAAALKG